MKRILFIVLLTLSFVLSGNSQINQLGVPGIRYYPPDELLGSEQNWTVIQDDRGVVYVGTNDKGILEFDGTDWRNIDIPKNAAIRILKKGVDGTIYVGGQGDFGYLAPNSSGNMEYISLVSKLDSSEHEIRAVYSIINWNQKVYFCEYGYIHEYDPGDGSCVGFDLEELGIEYGRLCFNVNNHFYLYDPSKGIYEFYGDDFVLVPGSDFFGSKFVLSVLPYENSKILVITYQDGAFTYDLQTNEVKGGALPDIANDFIKTNRFYRAVRLPDGKYILGTLDAGLFITDVEGNYAEQINKESGLGNEVVTGIYFNPDAFGSGQLWLSLNIGLAKVEYYSPFRKFSENQGLAGGINAIIEYNNTLFVGTSSGVFYRTIDELGFYVFNKIEEISSQCWSFIVFTHPRTSRPVLWAGTEPGGIWEISEDFEAHDIEELNPGIETDLETFMLNYSEKNPTKVYVGTGSALVELEYKDNQWFKTAERRDMNNEIRSIIQDSDNMVWAGSSLNGLGKFNFSSPSDTIPVRYGIEKGFTQEHSLFLHNINDDIVIATPDGLYMYDSQTDSFIPYDLFGSEYAGGGSIGIYRIAEDGSGCYYLSLQDQQDPMRMNKVMRVCPDIEEKQILDLPFKKLPALSTEAIHIANNGTVWLGITDQLFTYDTEFNRDYTEPFSTLIRNIYIGEDSLLFGGNYFEITEAGEYALGKTQPTDLFPSLKYKDNNLVFTWSSPYFDGEDRNEYSFRLAGFEDNWSRWTNRTEFPYINIPKGSLSFEVKARNVYGAESSVASFKFQVQPPWYLRIWAYFIYLAAGILLIVIIVKLYTQRLQNEKIRLEGIVRRRTAEVVRQKDELEDSITYASRIQKAILPSERLLNEQLPEHFIFFKPRDIVSGDFYWMGQKEDRIIVVAADCTGHGVPGAFMSLLGMSYLNEIVSKSDFLRSDEILNMLREEIMGALKQTGKEGEAKDGMDLALAICDKKAMKVQYSGAYNPMMIVRPLTKKEQDIIQKGESLDLPERSLYDQEHVLIQVNADKMPIGISAKDLKPFTCHDVDVKKGYSIYLASDGYVDQFGGPDGKKFMSRAFKKMLLEIQDKSMKKQGKILDEKFSEWKGDLAQVDDILVIGVKFD